MSTKAIFCVLALLTFLMSSTLVGCGGQGNTAEVLVTVYGPDGIPTNAAEGSWEIVARTAQGKNLAYCAGAGKCSFGIRPGRDYVLVAQCILGQGDRSVFTGDASVYFQVDVYTQERDGALYCDSVEITRLW